ncbi:MAG: ATP-binding protein [Ignavibacteriales bacterium]|nr:ATP-binding protein [Ignavibacteriales bacterium]
MDGVPIATWRFVVNNLTFLTVHHRRRAPSAPPIMESIRTPRAPQPAPARRDDGPAPGIQPQAQEPRRAQDPVLRQRQPRAAHAAHARCSRRPPRPSWRAGWASCRRRSRRTPARPCSSNGYKPAQAHQQPPRPEQARGGQDAAQGQGRSTSIDFVQRSSASVKPLADQKADPASTSSTRPTPVELTIDPDQFEKVVLNLLSNALKFTTEGRQDHGLRRGAGPARVILTVEDTGHRHPGQHARTPSSTGSRRSTGPSRGPRQGTGIGLALAREIVYVHRGPIRAESELGEGSRFIVELLKGDEPFRRGHPRTAAQSDLPVGLPEADRPTPRGRPGPGHRHRLPPDIQLVRPREGGLRLAGRGRRGARSTTTLILLHRRQPRGPQADEDAAARRVRPRVRHLGRRRRPQDPSGAKNPDLVLSDVMMPGMDGHALLPDGSRPTKRIKHIPVILVTARTRRPRCSADGHRGRGRRLHHPSRSTPIELKARIRSHLRMRQVEAELALMANRNLKMRTDDLVERQRTLFISMVKSLVSALEAKDFEYTRHHSTRVTEFSLRDRPPYGLRRAGAGRPRAGRPPPRRRARSASPRTSSTSPAR